MQRNAPIVVTLLLVLAGLGCLAAGIVYFTTPARSLPAFFLGHAAGVARHHTKHGAAAVTVAVALFLLAWVSSGTRNQNPHVDAGN